MFLNDWENSPCWDEQAPQSELGADAVPLHLPPPPHDRRTPKPDPLELGPGGLLAMLDVSVRSLETPEGAGPAVRSPEAEMGRRARPPLVLRRSAPSTSSGLSKTRLATLGW